MTAEVSTMVMSLPRAGSVNAPEAIHSPEATLGRYFSLCSSVPNMWIMSLPNPPMRIAVPRVESARQSSSMLRQSSVSP